MKTYKIDPKTPLTTQRVLYQLNAQGKTAQWLQQETGISQGAISKLVNGDYKNLSSDTICRLSRKLNVTTDYLLGLTAAATPDKPEIRAICDATGLSEKSVERLKTIREKSKSESESSISKRMLQNDLKTINYLLEEQSGDNLLCAIGEYIYFDANKQRKIMNELKKTDVFYQENNIDELIEVLEDSSYSVAIGFLRDARKAQGGAQDGKH